MNDLISVFKFHLQSLLGTMNVFFDLPLTTRKRLMDQTLSPSVLHNVQSN